MGGEGEMGEGEEVEGDEGRKCEIVERDEAAGREDHDEGDELEFDDSERAHNAAARRCLWRPLVVLGGLFWC